jgi:hypothetical protein
LSLEGVWKRKMTNVKQIMLHIVCGHCEASECVLKGNLGCLMCHNFVTTLDCISFFEKEIQKIDEMILKESLQQNFS